jgi:hypothetical protein
VGRQQQLDECAGVPGREMPGPDRLVHAVDGQPAVVADGEAAARQPGVDRRHHHRAHRGVGAASQVLEPPPLRPLAGRDRGHDHERIPRLGRRSHRPRLRHARAAQRPQRRLGRVGMLLGQQEGVAERGGGPDARQLVELGLEAHGHHAGLVAPRGRGQRHDDGAQQAGDVAPRPVDRDDAAGLELDQELGALVGRADRDERRRGRRRVRGGVRQLGDRRAGDPT